MNIRAKLSILNVAVHRMRMFLSRKLNFHYDFDSENDCLYDSNYDYTSDTDSKAKNQNNDKFAHVDTTDLYG